MFGLGLAELLVVAILCLMLVGSGRIMGWLGRKVGWLNSEKRLSPKERLRYGALAATHACGVLVAAFIVRELFRGSLVTTQDKVTAAAVFAVAAAVAAWFNPWKKR